ncbi:hypothetical protein H1R17_10620 [Flavobacterium sp. xlx-214]|uniref:hypothetical protein n=1 Tax=unclassified Flavobacterium TaxID=196869 RepID=UPI0013D69073|nr:MULTISPECIES: hypothetical protein [unclassified Flavobacterium]MBA5791669.1 hypothetical protein [Flavobacterium sp. xlx-221]QMI82912.1 hypothetical protein H1R17_10620 [Flavobacterium sp. xlx-214]
MNEFYNKLHEFTLSELEQFHKEILNLNEAIITKEITLKNGLMIRISKWLGMDAFVKFNHKTDISSYTFDELITLNYIPEKYQNEEFLEVHSRNLAFGNMV